MITILLVISATTLGAALGLMLYGCDKEPEPTEAYYIGYDRENDGFGDSLTIVKYKRNWVRIDSLVKLYEQKEYQWIDFKETPPSDPTNGKPE